jgi:hypothetical protein
MEKKDSLRNRLKMKAKYTLLLPKKSQYVFQNKSILYFQNNTFWKGPLT